MMRRRGTDRRQAIRDVAARIEGAFGDYVISVAPDLPHLIVAPDILIGGRGRLFALFVPSAVELHEPDQLLTRLIVTRLSLPGHLRCALLVDNNTGSSNFVGMVGEHFQGVLDRNDTREVARFITAASSRSTENIVPLNLRMEFQHRGQVLFEESRSLAAERAPSDVPVEPTQLLRALQHEPGYELLTLTSYAGWPALDVEEPLESVQAVAELFAGATEPLRPAQVVAESSTEADRAIVGALAFGKLHQPAALRPFAHAAIQRDYGLEDGIPYARNRAALYSPRLLLTDIIPTSSRDPLKPIRGVNAGRQAGRDPG